MEVAARNQLLKERGYDAARRFAERVDELEARWRPARGAPARRGRGEAAVSVTRRAREPAAPRDHRPLRLGQDPRLARPRGRGLVLRRQPAHRPHPALRRPLRRSRELRRSALVVDMRERELPERVSRRSTARSSARGRRGEPAVPGGRREGRCCAASARRGGRIPWPSTSRSIEGIREEREALRPIRKMADLILDTSRLHRAPAARLRARALRRCGREGRRRWWCPSCPSATSTACPPRPTSSSTCASCPTRTSCPRCKRLTGHDAAVVRYLRRQPETAAFLRQVLDLLGFVLPALRARGQELPHDRRRLHRAAGTAR